MLSLTPFFARSLTLVPRSLRTETNGTEPNGNEPNGTERNRTEPNGNACYAGYITTVLKDHFSFGVSLHCCRPVKSYVNSRLGEEGECMLFKDALITLKPFFYKRSGP